MAGSPEYLAHLDDMRDYRIPTEWRNLHDAWDSLTKSQTVHNLEWIARVAFGILEAETGESLDSIIDGAKQLHVNKNAGYAGADNPDPWANFRLSQAFGISPLDGVFVRMSDKYIRITNLRRDPTNERVGESILDTLRDLAAYALIAVCLIEEDKAILRGALEAHA